MVVSVIVHIGYRSRHPGAGNTGRAAQRAFWLRQRFRTKCTNGRTAQESSADLAVQLRVEAAASGAIYAQQGFLNEGD
jgi:hypothetical protein